jgi:SSS family solute:Na+ symporter
MTLHWLDYTSIVVFFVVTLGIGIAVAKKAGTNTLEFFASGRNMPWWLLGVSMVATTFSADTPNLVTDIVRQQGVAGNWQWWAFLLTGMVTVFIYARLWRRSRILTDLEFYEMRYSGKAAAFLRGFRAIYLGLFFNVVIMATVLLAAIKIAAVMLGMSAVTTVLIVSLVTVIYSSLGGLRAVLITDFIQFAIAMIGSVYAAIYIVNMPEIGGLSKLVGHSNVFDKLSLLPDFNDTELVLMIFIIPLTVQWWSVWYPGAEPGGGGYVAQRMLAARDENHAVWATLFFNFAHYALRPWPWILVALASLVVYPDLAAINAAFPAIDPALIKHDTAYSAMLIFLPAGALGVVLASLIAAVMSTISTHLNWGASYLVNDFYRRFMNDNASEASLVKAGRLIIVILMLLSSVTALYLENALQAFHILLQIGAGTGLLFLLRWFWWRINAASEIAAMIISFVVALYFEFFHQAIGFAPLASWMKLVIGVGITTVGWLTATLLTAPADISVLQAFVRKVRPGGPGWKHINADETLPDASKQPGLARPVLAIFLGVTMVYSALFSTGFFLYGKSATALLSAFVFITAAGGLISMRRRL